MSADCVQFTIKYNAYFDVAYILDMDFILWQYEVIFGENSGYFAVRCL